jgi:ribonuclease J
VVYGSRALVHVSGHGSRDEIATMLQTVKPRDIVPFHGEHRHTALYRDLAIDEGYTAEQVHIAENGNVISITPDKVTVEGKVESGYVYVDGVTVGEVGDIVIRDRRALARDGILMVIVAVDRDTGQIVAGPDIATRGFVHAKGSSKLLDDTKEHLRTEIGDGAHFATSDWGYLSRQLRDLTANYLHRNTKRRPMILPMVMEV